MNFFAIVFLLINTALLLSLPRGLAPLPLLIGACYMTLGQGIDLGPFTFTVVRMLVAAGVVRIVIRGERLQGGLNALDWLIIIWAIWLIISSVFHNDPAAGLTLRLGLVYNACGIYFLLRIFCQSIDDVMKLCRLTVILLIPIAVEMLYETLALHNLFSELGRVHASPVIRAGRVRAQGPFAHAILAGTVGALCLPFAISLWRQHRKEAVFGIAACMLIIFFSSSSGPIMSAAAGIGALTMWNYRHRIRLAWWVAIIAYLSLELIMSDPAYYVLARIDLTGGSTGWHRARLIQSAIEHLSEWWLGGTDYTRNWTATLGSSPNHTDITNYYIRMGVWGGLPLMLLFIMILVKGFNFVGRTLRERSELIPDLRFMVWALGASLFALAATFVSVTPYDQSYVFLYLTLAAIGSSYRVPSGNERNAQVCLNIVNLENQSKVTL